MNRIGGGGGWWHFPVDQVHVLSLLGQGVGSVEDQLPLLEDPSLGVWTPGPVGAGVDL